MSRKMIPTISQMRLRIPVTLTLAFTFLAVVLMSPLYPAATATGADETGLETQQRKPQNTEPPIIDPMLNICCGAKPQLKNIPNYAATYGTFTKQVAVATNLADNPSKPSVVIWDLKNQAGAPHGAHWNGASPPTTSFSMPGWSDAMIGTVFGLTLDRSGNIYVGATRVYNIAHLGTLPGSAGYGDIYKIDGTNGAVSRFVQTVNATTYSSGNKIPNTGPGLGNLTYSCQYDKFYVANLEDGVIYRIDSAGNILSRFDHGQNVLPVVLDNQTTAATQLGRRPFAVQVRGDELFYSLWNEDQGRPSNTTSNEIWAVKLDPSGDFIPGPPTRKITLPPLSLGGSFSNPVTDISFNKTGSNMLLSERSMVSDSAASAHQSRGLEYTFNGSTWNPELTNKFQVGTYSNHTNCAGGGSYDSAPGGLVWNTGDALIISNGPPVDMTYGLQGSSPTGGTGANSILIDLDDDVLQQDKTEIGDVEIPCYQCPEGPPKPTISGPESTCAPGTYCITTVPGITYSWSVTAGTGQVSTNGACITVTWGLASGKSVTVTATNAAGCKSSTTLNLRDCDLHLGECCRDFKCTADLKDLADVGSEAYNFSATLTPSINPVTRVTANIVSSSVTYSPATCGVAGPVNDYVVSAQNVGGLVASIPITNGHEVIWFGTPTNVSGMSFQIQIKFPPPPRGRCQDFLTFCIKYTFTDNKCKTCEVIQCYGPFRRGGGPIPDDPTKNTTD